VHFPNNTFCVASTLPVKTKRNPECFITENNSQMRKITVNATLHSNGAFSLSPLRVISYSAAEFKHGSGGTPVERGLGFGKGQGSSEPTTVMKRDRSEEP
jgi:hypothetical protein